MRKVSFFLPLYCFLFLLLPSLSYSQVEKEMSIIFNLKTELENDNNVKEVKLIHTLHENGMTNELCLGVKYNSDSTDVWWSVGPEYKHRRNGQLHRYSTTDVSSNIICDSCIIYARSGKIKSKIFYLETYDQTVGAVSFYESKDTLHLYFPNQSTVEKYKYKGKKMSEIETKQRTIKPFSYVLHGISTKYNYKKGTVNEKVYEKGVLISDTTRNLTKSHFL